MLDITINIRGNPVTLEELKSDVTAAKEKGYHDGKFAFTVSTVEGLIEKIEELGNEILTLRDVLKRG
jgi:metal-responsive CopG/Arc/MetJ family transcriptional regulator